MRLSVIGTLLAPGLMQEAPMKTTSRASFFPKTGNANANGSIPGQEVFFRNTGRRSGITITKTGFNPVIYWAQAPNGGRKVQVQQTGQNLWSEI